LAATAGSATETRERAQGLLDDVVRRGQSARERVARGGEEATSRLAEALSDLRAADDEGLGELADRLTAVERRLAALETELRPAPAGERAGPERSPRRSNSQVEVEDTPVDPDGQRDSEV
jgi:polyhydroxyalkanoate synthesis regulator phasin